MTKKSFCIAIPIEQGELCAHFGHCEKFAIFHVKQGSVTEMQEIIPPEHVPGLYPGWVAKFGVTDVIAGGMGQRAIDLFNQQGINVFVGAPVKKPGELVADFLSNELTLQANYCNHDVAHDHDHGHNGCQH